MTGVLHTIYMFDIWRYLYVWWIFFVYFYSIPLWIFAILCILLGVNGKLLFLITLRNFLSWSIWLRYIYVCIYCWYMEHEFFDSCSGTNIYFWISFSPAVVSLELFSLSLSVLLTCIRVFSHLSISSTSSVWKVGGCDRYQTTCYSGEACCRSCGCKFTNRNSQI